MNSSEQGMNSAKTGSTGNCRRGSALDEATGIVDDRTHASDPSHTSCRFGLAPGARRPGEGRLFLLRRRAARRTRRRRACRARRWMRPSTASARPEGARLPEAPARIQDADLGLCRGPGRRRAGRRRQGGDGEERRRARPGRAGLRRQPLHAGGDLGGRIEFRHGNGRAAAGAVALDARPAWASAPAISAPN